MATKKASASKTAPAKKAVPAKKAIPAKKVVPAKGKLPASKVAPPAAKKPIAAKKALPAKKAAPAKKATPTKKVVAKPEAKNVVVKKSVPAKKVAPLETKKPVTATKANTSKQITKPTAATVTNSKNKGAAPKTISAAPQTKSIPLAKKIETKTETKKAIPTLAEAVKEAKKNMAVASQKTAAKPAVQKPVVLPKINTKTSRKYEPDFTKSVLDKAPQDPGAPIMMYSDTDLAEFKELIQRKLGSAKKELAYLQGLITRKDDMGGDEGDGRYMTMEDGSLSMEREQLSQMASRQITFVDHLEKALIRIENKTYGVCRVTGKLIDKARLRAVPHATLSIEAKMNGGK